MDASEANRDPESWKAPERLSKQDPSSQRKQLLAKVANFEDDLIAKTTREISNHLHLEDPWRLGSELWNWAIGVRWYKTRKKMLSPKHQKGGWCICKNVERADIPGAWATVVQHPAPLFKKLDKVSSRNLQRKTGSIFDESSWRAKCSWTSSKCNNTRGSAFQLPPSPATTTRRSRGEERKDKTWRLRGAWQTTSGYKVAAVAC